MEHYTKIKCPHCGGENISKNGIEKGVQRYRCNNSECKKGFRENYVNKGCNPEINKQIDAMTINGSGVRDICRVLDISKGKILSHYRKKKSKKQIHILKK